MGRIVVLALVISILTITDTNSSVASTGNLPPAPSLLDYRNNTQPVVDDELIYVTNVAPSRPQPATDSAMDHNESMHPPSSHSLPPYSDSTAGYVIVANPSDELKSPITTLNSMGQNKLSLDNSPRLLDRDYASSTAEPAWIDEEQLQSHSLTRGAARNFHGDISSDDAHSDSILQRFQVAKDEIESEIAANAGIDDETRLQSFVVPGSTRNDPQDGAYPGSHGGIRDDAYREVSADEGERRVTASTAVLVWGEVGRGLVAATEDYRGELGRRPLILGGSRGRARSGPYFEEDSPPPNITAPSGSTVYMDCRVAMLQDKVVTWAARRDDRLQLLTVGKQAYSADKRLSLSFRYPNNWRLKILGVQRQDRGLYECQVAAHPPIIRHYHLTVISPEVSIWDESGRAVVERYYKAGSFLQLTCSAGQLLQPPELLGWWRGASHLTEGISCNVTGVDSATCTLVVEQVTRAHAGTYTCGAFPGPAEPPGPEEGAAPSQEPERSFTLPQPENYANATVAVHVLHGNLLGVAAVLPNTGKSVGATAASYISVHRIIIGLSVALFLRGR